ncbi:MAG: hypothetical protein Q4B85_11495 [Lachnospiraceae bacterium]|nr:hypothetical protein [Lachnospiraceae bacterium]
MKRTIALFMACILFLTQSPVVALATETAKEKEYSSKSIQEESVQIGEKGGYLATMLQTTRNLYIESKFTWENAGKGFAAERGNNLSDVWRGKKASIVGDTNELNGADRKIINRRDGSVTLIQDKYYKNPSDAMKDIFSAPEGHYRYITDDGQVMQLEVPPEQYDKYVSLLEKKIEDGAFGDAVTDPAEAKNIVRKGKYTFEQAENLTKAGNIDSLKYDAQNGVIVAAGAMGISFVLDYVSCKMNGLDNKEALKNSALDSLKNGSIAFCTYVVSSQLAKTGLKDALAPTAEAVAKKLGNDISKAILEKYGIEASKLTAESVQKNVAKVLEKEMITTGVLIVVVTLPDIYNLCSGRISAAQFAKNLAVTVVSIAGGTVGGTAGAAVGTLVLPGIGTKVGAVLGSLIAGVTAGTVSDLVLSQFFVEDSEKMYDIVTAEFAVLADKYLINEAEADEIIGVLQKELTDSTLMDMYQSENRNEYAVALMEPLFVDQIQKREEIQIPAEEEIRVAMMDSMEGIVFIH